MMNEAHNGWKRCVRTRQIGKRILPVAHKANVRHLAMETLYQSSVVENCNATRRLPQDITGYPSQPEMREFIQSALDLGWTLISYEADGIQWLSEKHDIKLSNPDNWDEIALILQSHQAELASMEFTNWREEKQAENIMRALASLPEHTPLLVWCGNSHHSKKASPDWIPMGYHFQQNSDSGQFVIDQIRTVKFDSWVDPQEEELIMQFSDQLTKYGGTAGFLIEEIPSSLVNYRFDELGGDAFLLSTQNELE